MQTPAGSRATWRTERRDGRLVTAGGRVLTVVGRGAGYGEAIDVAFAGEEVSQVLEGQESYDLVVRFPKDTVYSLVATVSGDGRTDFVEVRNIYAGESAREFLADHSPEGLDAAATDSR